MRALRRLVGGAALLALLAVAALLLYAAARGRPRAPAAR